MVRTDILKGRIAELGKTGRSVACELGISEGTFYSKMKSGKFDSDEMYALIKILKLENPCQIFFAPNVSQ